MLHRFFFYFSLLFSKFFVFLHLQIKYAWGTVLSRQAPSLRYINK